MSEFTKNFRIMEILNIYDKKSLEHIVQDYTNLPNSTWFKHSCMVNITRQSKYWWNENCQEKLTGYRLSKSVKYWKDFKKTVKITKCAFFDNKIQEITLNNCKPWDLID